MKKIVTVRHHVLINHRKGHSLALNSHSSKKYSGIHRPKFDLMVRLVSVYQLIQVITDLAIGYSLFA